MKTLLTVLACLAIIVAVTGYTNVQNGYYFSGEALITHAVDDFPEAPTIEWGTDDFFTVALELIQWCGDFVNWIFGFNPWVKGTPPYREDVFPWKAVA